MELKTLIEFLQDKTFKVFVSGEYERDTDFWGMIKIIANYSSFLDLNEHDRKEAIASWITDGIVSVDSQIYLKIVTNK